MYLKVFENYDIFVVKNDSVKVIVVIVVVDRIIVTNVGKWQSGFVGFFFNFNNISRLENAEIKS